VLSTPVQHMGMQGIWPLSARARDILSDQLRREQLRRPVQHGVTIVSPQKRPRDEHEAQLLPTPQKHAAQLTPTPERSVTALGPTAVTPTCSPGLREPNSSPNAGRGRVYDELSSFADCAQLRSLCAAAVQSARAADGSVPNIQPTHLLLVHYSHGHLVRPGIFWHKDDAPNDGVNEQPVVSFSLGETCLFRMMHGWSFQKQKQAEQAGLVHNVELRSGDAIIFGGRCRYMHHTVQAVRRGTCPPALAGVLGESRINLAFREAPDINTADYQTFAVGGGRSLSKARTSKAVAGRLPASPTAVKRAPSFDHPLYNETPLELPAPRCPDSLVATREVQVLEPGLVVMRGCVTEEAQRWLATLAMERGAEAPPRGFWRMRL